MHAENPKNAVEFLQKTQIVLEKDEVRGNLVYGLANNLIKNEYYYGSRAPFYSIICEKSDIKIIGLMTFPHSLVIYQNGNYDDVSMDLFIENVLENFDSIPGINGELEQAETFRKKWIEKTGYASVLNRKLRCFKLEKVNEYIIPEGIFRQAGKNDIETLKKFIVDFSEQINEPVDDYEKLFRNAEQNILSGLYYVWESGSIVSMAQRMRPTKNGMAVSSVYTPKEYRNKGYGTAVVSELSRNILNSGKTFCTLYTDLSNPVSNSIYQKIGYKKVCDNINYIFIRPGIT